MGLKYERKIILIVQIVLSCLRDHGTDSRMTIVDAKPSGGKKGEHFFVFEKIEFENASSSR